MHGTRSDNEDDGAQTNSPPALPALAVTPPAGPAHEPPLSTAQGVQEMRRDVAEQRGHALVRVQPGLYTFGCGNG